MGWTSFQTCPPVHDKTIANRLVPVSQWKISFLQYSLTRYINHTLGQAPTPGTKLNGISDSFCFALAFIYLFIFCLCFEFPFGGVSCVLFLFLCCSKVRERKGTWSWVIKEVERIWEESGEVKYDQNISYEIFFSTKTKISMSHSQIVVNWQTRASAGVKLIQI